MGRVDHLLPVLGAVLRAGLLVLPASAHAGGVGEGGHAAFSIKPVSGGGDVKARLWGEVSVAKLAPDLSVKCEDSASRYPWKIEIVSTVFWVGETGSGANSRAARGTRIGRELTGVWMIRYGETVLSRLGSGRSRIRSTQRCHTAICRQDG